MIPRVCFIAGTLGRGGAERQLVYMIRALKAAGAPVRVLSLTRGEVYEREIEDLGVPVTWIGQAESRAMRAAATVRELRRHPADVVHCAQMFVNLYAVAGARACGGVELGAVRTDLSGDLRGAWWLLGRASLRLPRFVLANSFAGAEAARAHARADRVLVLPNVVDTDRFHPPAAPRDRGLPVRILFLGRLHAQKRPDRFLRAVAELQRRRIAPTEVWLAGDGPQRDQLEALAGSLGATVRFLGQHPDTAALLREVDLVVLTSDTEGQPNTLIEAMATGLPVLATRTGGVEEVVPNDAGVIVDRDDEVALADELCALVADRARRLALGNRGLAYVRRERSTHDLADRLLAIYGTVLARR
jgi:glycosyltransferase involved in cell wall biosynthesis